MSFSFYRAHSACQVCSFHFTSICIASWAYPKGSSGLSFIGMIFSLLGSSKCGTLVLYPLFTILASNTRDDILMDTTWSPCNILLALCIICLICQTILLLHLNIQIQNTCISRNFCFHKTLQALTMARKEGSTFSQPYRAKVCSDWQSLWAVRVCKALKDMQAPEKHEALRTRSAIFAHVRCFLKTFHTMEICRQCSSWE